MTLKNKIIAITGATGTIGSAVAKLMAKKGACVILIARNQSKLEALYDEIVEDNKNEVSDCSMAHQPYLLPLDFRSASSDDFFKVAQTIGEHFGELHGLVNTVAHRPNLTPLSHVNHQEWLLNLHIGLNCTFFLTQSCLPLLYKAQSNCGQSSNVISCHHEESTKNAYWGGYGVAKAGLNTMMKLFAQENEVHHRINFNSIDPVGVNSNLRYQCQPNGADNPFEPKNVAEKICELLDNSKNINGKNITMSR